MKWGEPADACRREFGFVLEERAICCDDVRVRATGAGAELPRSGELAGEAGPLPAPTCVTSAYFEACCQRYTPRFSPVPSAQRALHVQARTGVWETASKLLLC